MGRAFFIYFVCAIQTAPLASHESVERLHLLIFWVKINIRRIITTKAIAATTIVFIEMDWAFFMILIYCYCGIKGFDCLKKKKKLTTKYISLNTNI